MRDIFRVIAICIQQMLYFTYNVLYCDDCTVSQQKKKNETPLFISIQIIVQK